ncbi:FMN-binding negative transcriptional regulator [Sandaracinobacteroides saxicola]|uniref:FMN-binding negative transcriptional regulator n=1 Tax=Sandaracinobacteroides saxicola TaxID=2759707 RepID=A0A7G5IFM7_9SPHN|nr:FMN-binding negative transcriptional regulator [Sandaracinobacteroides saxicola]QMW22169.1 FMN-binding negative transcriptional regulator [Sandaracinobacteroides saxicola]
MHPARAFAWEDEAALRRFAHETAFARLFLTTPEGPRVAHAPVLVQGDGALRFHLANANALVKHLDGAKLLALWEGPNGYLSANWYADIRGAVPSWNYVAVECEGTVRRLDLAALVALLDQAAAVLEPRVGEDWTRAKMEPARFEAMTRAITAFELVPVRWRGTCKASQNKPAAEAARLIAAMARTAPAMTDVMQGARA